MPDAFYEEWYDVPEDDPRHGWRILGARYKAAHIARMVTTPGDRICDVGGGGGAVASLLHRTHGFPEIDVFEVSSSAVAYARKQPGVKSATTYDGLSVEVPDLSYDLAIASHVVEHVDNPRHFLAELRRIAHTVFIEVPIDHQRRINAKALAAFGHIHVFTPSIIRFYLEQSGFEPISESGFCMQRRYDMIAYNRFRNQSLPDTFANRARLIADVGMGELKRRLWPPAERWSEWCIYAR
ncbi:MAG: methyltransferase domain-containing protein [Pseudomonadota bacterium]